MVESSSASRWLALDIGGANLKAAHSDGPTTTAPFEVWRQPAELGKAIADLAAALPPFDRATVTMTAELCDCYPTKAEGVLAVLAASAQALGNRPLSVWGIDGRFHELDEIRRRPVLAAAANWLALATAGPRSTPHGTAWRGWSARTERVSRPTMPWSSRSAAECLLRRLAQAAHRVCQATIGIPDVAVVAGSGEFLARRLAARVLGPDRPIISLAEAWGCAASTAGCARALLTLVMEHENPL